MLIRTHDLRSEFTQFCKNYSVTYLLLDNDEWSQIEYLIELLKSFCLFIKVLSFTRTFTINMIFKIYNRLFEHLKKTSFRLARKRVSWKKNLMKTIKAIQPKLTKYYNQTQNDLELFYDKTILLHSTIDDSLFQTFEWKVESEKTFWHEVYWNALKEMYNEYKHQTSDNIFFNDKQTALIFSSKTLNDLLNDIVNVQTSSNENEFTSYRRQNMFLWHNFS
jgi:6-pyruvoyl-tetrahydropterin synthase